MTATGEPQEEPQEELVFLNGEVLPVSEARISPRDRGFLFADGVYEVTRFYGGELFQLDEHVSRLNRSLREIDLELPSPAPDWGKLFSELIRENLLSDTDGFVYLQVTRGAAPRGHAFPDPPVPPTTYATATARPRQLDADRRQRGVIVITHPDERWGRCDIKSVALLPNVLASERAARSGAHEAILVRDGVVTEGSHSSAFAVVNGEVRTHPLNHRVLPGITRAFALTLCDRLEIPFSERALTTDELRGADEVLLTGTGSEILPVIAVDGEEVGKGVPGPVARALQDAFEREVTRFRRGE
jgi:D-alanine transaminase